MMVHAADSHNLWLCPHLQGVSAGEERECVSLASSISINHFIGLTGLFILCLILTHFDHCPTKVHVLFLLGLSED